ncbi:MAG: hypothetical protein M3Y31_08470 [Gemmatimonadota bacterium]|nr:hypothetical protein [Gemmatimonadota bacterium]
MKIRCFCRAGLPATALVLALATTSRAQVPAPDYRAFADSLERLAQMPAKAADVSSLVLVRDRGTLTLEGGRIYLLAPLGGRPVAAVYEGSGRFRLEPPLAAERVSLARFHKAEQLDTPFSQLVMVFADSTPAALAALPWADAAVPGSLERRWKQMIDFSSGWKQKTLDPDLAAPLLNGTTTGFFHAQIAGGGVPRPIAFRISPNDLESVQLLTQSGAMGYGEYMEMAARFRPDGDEAPVLGDRRDGVQVRHYTIDATFDRTGTGDVSFRAKTTAELTAARAAGPWIPLSLYSELEVDSARWSDGGAAPFFKNEDGSVVWVRSDRALAGGEQRSLVLWYHGDLVERLGDWFFINSSSSWYPRPLEGRSTATFDITFNSPRNYRIASVGRMTDSTVADQRLTTRWVADRPMRNAGFNLGLFEDYAVSEAGAPPVTVLWSDLGHKAIARMALESGNAGAIPSSAGKKEVGADVANALKFFSRVFGSPPVERFYATEIPAGHGEAFPGLVHLSWVTFMSTDTRGADEWFRAHEVAHQWWGIGVDFATYRDQWLSEGFSSFAGLWYLQTARNDNKRYFDMLDRWRGEIARRTTEGGPISLGYRTATLDNASDYQTLVYYKGAWVVHMLRIMMLDLRTMNEDRFTRMMQDFYATYSGKRASTEDFRRTAEKHMAMDLGWFFDQWVNGTAVPTYRASYETAPLDGGKVKMTVRVIQENVPEGFTAYVPVTVALDGDQVLRTRVKVTGRETVAELPILPGQPKKFTFNDFQGVLAVVK